LCGRISAGIDCSHSSVLLNTGSMSKMTPRERMHAVFHHLTDLEFRFAHLFHQAFRFAQKA
jgi:hypothetical protein